MLCVAPNEEQRQEPTEMIKTVAQHLPTLLCLIALNVSAQANELKPADIEAMNTASVADTLAELRNDVQRVFVDQNGWLVAEKRIEGGSELWSFVPEAHEAYPAAVQRLITDGDGGLKIEMNIQCDAPQQACDDLNTLFSVMNENLVAISKDAPPIREPDTAKQ